MKNLICSLAIALGITTAVQAASNRQSPVSDDMTTTADGARPATDLKPANRDAQYPGGMDALKNFLSKEAYYSEFARINGYEGMVKVQFSVNPDGSLTDVTVLESPNSILEADALKTVEAMPDWEPAIRSGVTVKKKVIIQIRFRLE